MLNNKPIIGYLAPDGKFTACFTYNHTDCAMKICNDLGVYFQSFTQAEDYLLDSGYICFRARDVLYHTFASDEYKKYCNISQEFVVNLLTDAQKFFIDKHNQDADWNNSDQAEDIHKLLKEQAKVERYLDETTILNPSLSKLSAS